MCAGQALNPNYGPPRQRVRERIMIDLLRDAIPQATVIQGERVQSLCSHPSQTAAGQARLSA